MDGVNGRGKNQWFQLLGVVQVQHGAHEDRGRFVTGEGQVDRCFKFLIIAEALEVD